MRFPKSIVLILLLAVGAVAYGGGQTEAADGESAIATGEAPMLAEMVSAGELPPVEDRLPDEPVVIEPWESVGEYGGTWRMLNQRDDHAYEAFHFYEPILRFSMYDWEPVPNLAESWEESDGGRVYTFRLRQGIKWSDGEPFTADDILFFVEDIVGNEELFPAYPSWLMSAGERPEVEKLDDYTVRFSYSEPSALFLRQLARPFQSAYRAKHYLEQFHPDFTDADEVDATVEAEGFDDWVRLFLQKMDYNVNEELPVLTAWKREATLTDGASYVRNPYYWKVDSEGNQLPYIDRIRVDIVANTEVAQLRTFAGERDLDLFVVGQFPRDTMVLKENEAMGNYTVFDAPIAEPNVFVLGINLNQKDPVLREIVQDRRFRIAMSHAIDRKTIRELIYLDQPIESHQVAPLPESAFYHEGAAKNYVEFDPETANALLDEMGLTERNREGIRLRSDGEPLELVLESRSFRDDFLDALELIADWWTEVGVKASVRSLEGSLFNVRRAAGDYDVSADFAGNGLIPLAGPQDYIPVDANNNYAPLWGQWYATGGSGGEEPPEEVKTQLRLYERALVTSDQDEQVNLWRQIMDIQAENLYHIGISDRATVPMPVHNRMRNVPTEGWNLDWAVGNIGVTHPEQYWIAQ